MPNRVKTSSTLTIRLTAVERARLAAEAEREGRSIGAHVKAKALVGTQTAPSAARSDIDRLLALSEEFRIRGWKRTDEEIARSIEAERADR